MKKMAMILVMAMVSSNSYASEDIELFLDANASIDEYSDEYTYELYNAINNEEIAEILYEEDLAEAIDEYDQNVTDNVAPVQVSSAEVLFHQAMGALLVHYINLRESAREYFEEAKNLLIQWYHSIIKAK